MGIRIRERLTFANVMSVIAVFIALGGSAYAVIKIGPKNIRKNAVRSKHIKQGQVKPGDLAPLPGPKAIAANPLNATDPCDSGTALVLCGFFDGGSSDGNWVKTGNWAPPSAFKDASGVVHLTGVVTQNSMQATSSIVILPAGYRPAADHGYVIGCATGISLDAFPYGHCAVAVRANGLVEYLDGDSPPSGGLPLDSISFRAG
jgi:hypothetical protein